MEQDKILIIDMGSTRNTYIAREIREMGVFTEIHHHDMTTEELSKITNIKGIVLNGGENRIVEGVAIEASEALMKAGVPVLSVDHNGSAPWPEDIEARLEKLQAFVFGACNAQANWNMENFIAEQIAQIKAQVGDGKVLLALSGGVDSSVVAALLIKAIGKQLTCVHVNHGLLRKGEPEEVVHVFREEMGANLVYVDAVDRFLDKLAGVSDPEKKRMIIGAEFIRVFEDEARKLEDVKFLAQGTIYPDIIESGTKTVKAVKSHHNVGGLPEDLEFDLVEPLKMLFKDEVRECGLALGLPRSMVFRQPFPGPGLGVRCIGAITRDRLEAVRESDAILREEFAKAGLEGKVWQYFTVVPDVKSVGVRDHKRSFEWPVVLRAVNTVDAMTATVERVPYEVLEIITHRITHEVKGVNRVLYDLTPKPAGTIEWE
ncbi:MAG: glutamine-hydrolyzing GMP synthase [Acidaminobacter sp.]|uniref:glutamine-hydrolyzing GMP synthase n=1 Tax=Acidaminobacter sp. TaxID=1872102 RepID=UPI00137FD3D3|nr:glutamine-hydrolyzing GMP synthase [Acidaminobacter sp.]MZQ99097.1 glutamine-hydrolyzing GMP synthase [Acidaminobacter sp.]